MKEIIKTIVIALLVVVAIYFSFLVGKLNERMDFLNRQDSLHTVKSEDFERQLHDLELKFIGRGKHIQRFQRALKELDLKLVETEGRLITKIDSVGLLLDEFKITTENELQATKANLDAIDERLTRFQRQMTSTTTDLQTAAIRLRKQLKELDDRLKAIEEKDKKKK